ncbi:terminase large subunit [Myroides odoratimimus]|uniref:terminase large subunit n=1 Tax=Myroides odoratimimus TaxID=76832 RepID=UPI0025771B34|nr:terminase TerL endonuclease subunit [Myroides odoratimimus]MDM1325904.1 terminase large subunit [Myroides odoratimimus]MDM1452191.1 terminase large subunit [Myroides odoratimimus]MDM1475470.1 terminase large subunit [Myroides odoratimimus]MDM1488243.1 terminase large subunit [Myroides odoratimimus]
MKLTKEMLSSPAFQYAEAVHKGTIKTGNRIKLAVDRFYRFIKEAEDKGFHLDHDKGMRAINFFPNFLNHTTGKMAGQRFFLAPFQAFTIYNLFAWVDSTTGARRFNTVYDKRAKKNGKTAEMAGLALYCMSFDMEMGAQIYVGATKEDQAKICWNQARMFIESPVANPRLRDMGFRCLQREIKFSRTQSVMMPLGGDSKTQDGINAHISIIDEYHAHKDDSVKENLESSSVSRRQPITYHITTAGTNLQSVCKNYEDAVIEVLEGRNEDDHLWIMIHDLDEGDDWEDMYNWYKANPLVGFGLDVDNIEKEYIKARNQPSKIPNFKTKHLNMWVDAPTIWIPNEVWMKNKVDEIPMEKFEQFGAYGALDLSTTTDITAFIALSEPDEYGDRYIKPFFFCPADTIEHRSKEDRVPYRYWADAGWLIATPGNVVDYEYVKDTIRSNYKPLNIERIEADKWNCEQMAQELIEEGMEVSYFSQAIGVISFPTKQFEKLVYEGKMKHDGNPILQWMLSGCIIYQDANDNIKVHKGQSNKGGKRIDGIVGIIMALGGSLSVEEDTGGKYSKPMSEDDIFI